MHEGKICTHFHSRNFWKADIWNIEKVMKGYC